MRILSKNVTLCNTVFSKGFGLMFTREKTDFAYVFDFPKSRKIVVTMMFVFYPIDILFLDEHGVIVDIVESLKPFSNYIAKKKARTFIEFPKQTINAKKIKTGMRVVWNAEKVCIL